MYTRLPSSYTFLIGDLIVEFLDFVYTFVTDAKRNDHAHFTLRAPDAVFLGSPDFVLIRGFPARLQPKLLPFIVVGVKPVLEANSFNALCNVCLFFHRTLCLLN